MCPINVRSSRGICMPSHPLSFTIPFLYFPCSGAYLSLGLRLPEGSWPCYKSERTLGTCGLWGTTLGSPLELCTRAETWVFPHNPRPLVFFLLHNPHFSSLCSLSCLKPNIKGVTQGYTFLGLWLVEGSQLWYKQHRLLGSCGVCDTLGVTRLRLVTPWVYPIHHSFLGVYLSLIEQESSPCLIVWGPWLVEGRQLGYKSIKTRKTPKRMFSRLSQLY